MTPAEHLERYRQEFGNPPRLGCDLISHRELGYCAGCPGVNAGVELCGWRLLAIVDKGGLRCATTAAGDLPSKT